MRCRFRLYSQGRRMATRRWVGAPACADDGQGPHRRGEAARQEAGRLKAFKTRGREREMAKIRKRIRHRPGREALETWVPGDARCLPSGVFSPVLSPPCNRQRVLPGTG